MEIVLTILISALVFFGWFEIEQYRHRHAHR